MMSKTGLMLAAAALAINGSAALAEEGRREHQQQIIIVNERHAASGHDAEKREGGAISIAQCDGEHKDFDNSAESQSAEGKKERSRVVICSRGDSSPAERAKRLEQALARIDANSALSAETKSRITTALRETIDRLKSSR